MFAIVDVAGKQFKVSEKKVVKVPFLKEEVGAKIEFSSVLLKNEGKKTTIGTPVIKGSIMNATVVKHDRESKVLVFKKKRRKGYRKKNGHRQKYSLIQVNSIT